MHPSAIYLLVLICAVSATAQRIVPEAGSDINKQFAMGADVFSLAMFELDGDDMEADEATCKSLLLGSVQKISVHGMPFLIHMCN